MAGVMKIMVTSFKRTCSGTVVFSAPDPAIGHCPPLPPQETEPDVPVSVQESLEEAWVDSGLPWGQGN